MFRSQKIYFSTEILQADSSDWKKSSVYGVVLSFFALISMPPKGTKPADKFTGKVDLAILNFDGLQEIARKAQLPFSATSSRTELVKLLRDAGHEKHSVQCDAGEVAQLRNTVEELRETVRGLVEKLHNVAKLIEERPSSPPSPDIKALSEDVAAIKTTVSGIRESTVGRSTECTYARA